MPAGSGVGVAVEVAVSVGAGVGVTVQVAVCVGVAVGVAVGVDVAVSPSTEPILGPAGGLGTGVAVLALGVGGAAMWVSVRATGRGVGVARWQADNASMLVRTSRMKTGKAREITRTKTSTPFPESFCFSVRLQKLSGRSVVTWPYVTTFRWI